MRFYDNEGSTCENIVDRIGSNIGIRIDRADQKRRSRVIDLALRDVEPIILSEADMSISDRQFAKDIAALIHAVNQHNSSNISYDGARIYEEAIERYMTAVKVHRITRGDNEG